MFLSTLEIQNIIEHSFLPAVCTCSMEADQSLTIRVCDCMTGKVDLVATHVPVWTLDSPPRSRHWWLICGKKSRLIKEFTRRFTVEPASRRTTLVVRRVSRSREGRLGHRRTRYSLKQIGNIKLSGGFLENTRFVYRQTPCRCEACPRRGPQAHRSIKPQAPDNSNPLPGTSSKS
jgi:hypothetical protein